MIFEFCTVVDVIVKGIVDFLYKCCLNVGSCLNFEFDGVVVEVFDIICYFKMGCNFVGCLVEFYFLNLIGKN